MRYSIYPEEEEMSGVYIVVRTSVMDVLSQSKAKQQRP